MVALPERFDLDRRPIPEQIADGLARLVLCGELPPGQPVHEGAIAADLGVSRNTVREAVRVLERSGLVRYESNRGAVVREPSHSTLEDVYRARLAVELGAVWTAEEGAFNSGAVDEALSAFAASLVDGAPDAAVTADLEFHAAIVAAAASTRLNEAFRALANELRLYLTIIFARHGQTPVGTALADNDEIAAALGADRNTLAAVLAQHIQRETAEALTIVDRFTPPR